MCTDIFSVKLQGNLQNKVFLKNGKNVYLFLLQLGLHLNIIEATQSGQNHHLYFGALICPYYVNMSID